MGYCQMRDIFQPISQLGSNQRMIQCSYKYTVCSAFLSSVEKNMHEYFTIISHIRNILRKLLYNYIILVRTIHYCYCCIICRCTSIFDLIAFLDNLFPSRYKHKCVCDRRLTYQKVTLLFRIRMSWINKRALIYYNFMQSPGDSIVNWISTFVATESNSRSGTRSYYICYL